MKRWTSCCAVVLAAVASASDFSIADFGAKPDGTLATAAFSNAVAACVAAGGGRVVVPAGRWTTGPVELKSDVELQLQRDAVLFMPDDPTLRPLLRVVYEGTASQRHTPGVWAVGCTNVSVTGSGTIESATNYWHANRRTVPRPQVLYFEGCRDVRLDGFRVRGSPSWTVHLCCCDDVTVRGLDVVCAGPNTDGIDLDSVNGALVENCRLDQGDDAFCIKSGKGADGRRRNRPSQNIVIRNCTVVRGHTLLGIGSELTGGIRNVRLENCRVEGEVWRFLRVKTNPSRGGFVENVRMENVWGERATYEVFSLETDYWWKQESQKNPEVFHTRIRGVHLKDVHCQNAPRVERRSVLKESIPPEDITLENVTVGAERGLRWQVLKDRISDH